MYGRIKLRALRTDLTAWALEVAGFTSVHPATCEHEQLELILHSAWKALGDFQEECNQIDDIEYLLLPARHEYQAPLPLIEACTYSDKLGNRGGRPSYEEDVWAWQQVHIHNRDRNEVFSEWLRRLNPLRAKKGDLRALFRNAINRDRSNSEASK